MVLAAAPNTCEGRFGAGVWAYIAEIRNRRLLVIDEQKGLAVGFSNLYHDGKLNTMKLKGNPGVGVCAVLPGPPQHAGDSLF